VAHYFTPIKFVNFSAVRGMVLLDFMDASSTAILVQNSYFQTDVLIVIAAFSFMAFVLSFHRYTLHR